MAARPAKRHKNKTRDGQIPATQVVDLGERRRYVEDTENDGGGGDENDHVHLKQQFNRSKTQISSFELRPKVAIVRLSAASRSSPRLRKLREMKAQLHSREERQTKRPSLPAQYQTQRGVEFQRNASERPQRVKRKQDLPNQGNPQARPLKSLEATRGKRERDFENEDELRHFPKRQRRQRVSGVPTKQFDGIEHWLNESCPSLRRSIADETRYLAVAEAMPRKSVLPPPVDSFDRDTTSSRKSERPTASVHDPDYRQSLRHRNIYINREDPSPELMQLAQGIVSRPRTSPEMDDEAAQQLIRTSRRVEDEAQDVIVKQLAPDIIPAMKQVPDQRLVVNSNQPWANSVPVLLGPSILTTPLPLPKPKPDLAFGYSQDAFTPDQLGTIELLIDDQFGRSYAVPDYKLQFPFLSVEFKSQAKNGTHYIGTNQAAGTGAIAINGHVELVERSFGMEKFNYDEPQFFSVTMDHEMARINVHWLKAPARGGNHSFHVEVLSQHLLRDPGGLRAVIRAIKNILDYGADTRLLTLCKALDAYREMVVRNREAANPQRSQRHKVQPTVHGEQMRRSTLEETAAKNLRYSRGDSANELVTEGTTKKRERHQPHAAQSARMSISNVAPISRSRHMVADNVAPMLGTASRHRNPEDMKRPKRQIRPSLRLVESRHGTIGSSEAEPKNGHHRSSLRLDRKKNENR